MYLPLYAMGAPFKNINKYELFINKELKLAFNPNIDFGTVDRSFRVIQDKAPGLESFDNPASQAAQFIQTSGDYSQYLKYRVTDDLVAKLHETYDQQLKTLNEKILYYPDTLRGIDDNTFANPSSFEVPRHALRITVMEYYGANIGTLDYNKILDTVKSIGEKTGSLISTIKEAVGGSQSAINNLGSMSSSLSEIAPMLKPESLAVQNRINGVSSNISEILRQNANPAKIEAQRETLRSFANSYVDGALGRTITQGILTGQKFAPGTFNFSPASIQDFLATSGVKIKLLPDEVKNIIYLYAPGDNLNYNYSTKWKSVELDNITFGALNTLSLLAEGKPDEASGAAIDTVTGIIKNSIPFDGIKTLVESKTGMTPAQNYEYMFDSVDRRKFGVSVTFMPKSDAEIESIGKIIAALKYYSHPSRPNMSYHYRTPAVFMLENITWVKGKGWMENLYLPKYKVAALQNINLRYDQNGTLVTHEELTKSLQSNDSTFKSPVKIVMSLSFEELVIVTREDLTPPQNFFDANRKNGYY